MKHKILGAGILAFEKSTGKILFGRRGMKGEQPNTWSPFGGTFEKEDQMPRNTAIREFKEETGCKCSFQLSKMPYYINDGNQLRFYTYLAIFDNEFTPIINQESMDYQWFDLNSLPENLHPGVQEMMEKKLPELKKFRNYLLKRSDGHDE